MNTSSPGPITVIADNYRIKGNIGVKSKRTTPSTPNLYCPTLDNTIQRMDKLYFGKCHQERKYEQLM